MRNLILISLLLSKDPVVANADFIFSSPFKSIYLSEYIISSDFKGVILLLVDWSFEENKIRSFLRGKNNLVKSVEIQGKRTFQTTYIEISEEEYEKKQLNSNIALYDFIRSETKLNRYSIQSSFLGMDNFRIKRSKNNSLYVKESSWLLEDDTLDGSDTYSKVEIWKVKFPLKKIKANSKIVISIYFLFKQSLRKSSLFCISENENYEKTFDCSFSIKKIAIEDFTFKQALIEFDCLGDDWFNNIQADLENLMENEKGFCENLSEKNLLVLFSIMGIVFTGLVYIILCK